MIDRIACTMCHGVFPVLDQTANSTPHGTAQVDLERVDQKRLSSKSLLKDRRPEVYQLG